METPEARQRFALFLWHARGVRARAAAADLVRQGHVRVNGQRINAPGHFVRPGQVLTIALDRQVRVLRIVRFSERRGDATSAIALFEEITEE